MLTGALNSRLAKYLFNTRSIFVQYWLNICWLNFLLAHAITGLNLIGLHPFWTEYFNWNWRLDINWRLLIFFFVVSYFFISLLFSCYHSKSIKRCSKCKESYVFFKNYLNNALRDTTVIIGNDSNCQCCYICEEFQFLNWFVQNCEKLRQSLWQPQYFPNQWWV